ncbi:FAD-binding oxidoreductase [Azospirillum sp.]|uniref:FAD-binding oxidoreductase n=1 Tax=Azospirillum sp. TaxID=34012 RepID=UPI002633186F|nr:FAD-binding oxidoreductase [Azospirillum sp.]
MTIQAVLPPGVSKESFAAALAEYRAIVGDQWVFVDLERLAPYSRLMVPDDDAAHQPCGAIAAGSVEEIQRILAVSNKYKIPLWTISVGRNFGYGEAAPATPGQMILDLKRMNRILEVDPELGTALVEPGVTFKQLHDYLIEHNLPFWFNKPAPAPVVGPMGFTLERGMGYTRYQEQAQNFSGMEVVLADGSVIRTGMGGAENAKTWQAYRWGYGPWIDGLFLQSNFGIVTKLGLWLMKRPAAHKTWAAGFLDIDGAARSVEVLRDLRLDGVIENGMVAHMSYGVALTQKRSDLFNGPGAIPEEMWAGMAKQAGLAVWSAVGTVFGHPDQIAINLDIIRKAMTAAGGFFITEEQVSGPASILFNNIKMITTDQLSLEDFAIFNYRGSGGAWFAPVIPSKAKDVLECYRISQRTLAEFGFDYIGGFMIGYSGRHFDAASIILYDRDNPEEFKRAKQCYLKVVDACAKAGYPLYRAGTPIMKMTADFYGEAQKTINARLKHMFDPNHILSPGKSGIA